MNAFELLPVTGLYTRCVDYFPNSKWYNLFTTKIKMKRNKNIVVAQAVECITYEQYQSLYSELLRIREELQSIKSTRGFDHTSIPDIPVTEPVVEPELVV